ncbi:hypothetical protein [Clostridium formicaceticum]|uniref:Uncharacterized protein n=1 Tax=Clostridium formicaceticum TaxID=1497 RepID=A0AAC9WHI9_9CLOT|nr:hypothetical protein [Clostridium formicaceticum]AOY77210.1 hypothetical protein BJL90_15950 [Clostridium formicaceticum]ARE87735.1 hypothetical protein CLFO_21350 [Clostridium formicaceticum]
MSEEIKRNCSSCKMSWLNRCETLKDELQKQGINSHDYMKKWDIEHKVKSNFICDNYKSIYIEYPIEVSKINANADKIGLRDNRIGEFVKIRPCGKEYQNKTYLGLYLGDLPIGHSISHNPETKELNVSFNTNPAIFVFDLNKIVYGMESWWGIINNENDLKEITDNDIDNVWYIKALKQLNESEAN